MSSLEVVGQQAASALFAAIESEAWSQVAEAVNPDAVRAFFDSQCQQAEQTEELRAMSPEALGWSPKQLRQYIPAGPDPFLRAIWGPAAGQERPLRGILGVVPQQPEFLHVVFQGPTGWGARQDWVPVDVLTFRATSEGWRALLNGNLVFDSRGGYSMALNDAHTQPGAE